MFETHISEEAGEIFSSSRWSHPDTPGSAHILSIGERVKSQDAFVVFRNTEEGKFLLGVIESYEDALNDDWMPLEIIGLPLDKAKLFIHAVWEELRQSEAMASIENLRECYAQLSKS
jgi:hypothetical protein